MASRFLYRVVPTEKLPTVMSLGFRPVGDPPRLWLYTDLAAAYFIGWLALHDMLSDAEQRTGADIITGFLLGRDIGWRWNGKEWQAVSPGSVSIIEIERSRVECFSGENPAGTIPMHPRLRRSFWWTPDHVKPPFTIRKLEREYFFSPDFRELLETIPAAKAALSDRAVLGKGGKIEWRSTRKGRLPTNATRKDISERARWQKMPDHKLPPTPRK